MRLLLVVACLLVAVAAVDVQESEQYGVLKPGAHEIANCVALQGAAKYAGATLPNNPFIKEFIPKFSPNVLNCNTMGSYGAVTAGIMGTVQEWKQGIANTWNKWTGKSVSQGIRNDDKSLNDLWPALILGSREMDLPCDDRDNALDNCLLAVAKGGILSKLAGLVMKTQDVDAATADLKTKTIEVNHFSPMAADSHFGYMSIGHAQTADRPTDKNVPGVVQMLKSPSTAMKRYKFPISFKGNANPTQADVRTAMIDFATHLYTKAVSAMKAKKADSQQRMIYHIGRLGHMIMDSYSCAHAVRQADAQLNFPVMYFQDYGAQDGSLHAQNGDSLIGGPPFLTQTFGFQHGIKKVAHVYQIILHKLASIRDGSKYRPVGKGVSANGADPALSELRAYLLTQVWHFAGNAFASFPAKGCVTKDTMAAKKEAFVCKAAETLANLKKSGNKGREKICPDRPADIKSLML